MQKAVVVAGYRESGKSSRRLYGSEVQEARLARGRRLQSQRPLGRRTEAAGSPEATQARGPIRILEASITKVKWPLSAQDLERVAIGFWNDLWSDLQKAIIARRGWEKDKKKGGYGISYDAIIRKHLPEFSDDQLAGFLMELSVARQIDGLGYGASKDRPPRVGQAP